MLIKAKLNYLKIAPRKVRLVTDLIKGKKIDEAQSILSFVVKKANEPLLKLLKQAIVNAKNSFKINESGLYISKIIVNEGPKIKRWRPRARGRAFEIQKKTSHITLVLDIQKNIKEEKKSLLTNEEKLKKLVKIKKIVKKEEHKTKTKKEIIKPTFNKEVKKVFRRKSF